MATQQLFLVVCLLLTVTLVMSRKQCNFPPGVLKFQQGVDISQFDLLANTNHGTRKIIFRFTCDYGHKWYMPIQPNAPSMQQKYRTYYDLPDQVLSLTTVPMGSSSLESTFYKSTGDVRGAMNERTGIQGNVIKLFSFAKVGSLITTEDKVRSQTQKIQDISASVVASKVDLYPYYLINMIKKVETKIASIGTGTYAENKKAYEDVIAEYGTHYMHSGFLGGVLARKAVSRSGYSQRVSSEKSTKAFQFSVLSLVSTENSLTKEEKTLAKEFTDNSDVEGSYHGGNKGSGLKNSWKAYTNTVFLAPEIIKCQLRPIYDLIRNKVHKENMLIATTQWVIKSYVETMINQMVALMGEKQGNGLVSTINALKGILDEEKKKTIMKSELVLEVYKEFDDIKRKLNV